MSSTTTTSGRFAASVSNRLRNAQAVSSGDPPSSCAPTAPAISRAATFPRSMGVRIRSSSASGSSPATSRTTSASGRYVMPWPYAMHRPTTIRASVSSEAISSRARRDFPMPGVPTIVASAQERSRTAASNAPRSSSSSWRRPTKGVEIGRANAGTSGRSPSSRRAASGSALPFAARGAVASATTASRTASYVASPSSTSPGAAACSRRAATLTASPVASFWSPAPPPTITSPVLIPVRVRMTTPCSDSSSALSAASRSPSSDAARTARSASSSRTAGMPKTAITASPMNFSTTPPCRSSTACTASK